MKIKIKKSVLREEYVFIVEIFIGKSECDLRIQGYNDIIKGNILIDKRRIEFKPITLSGYINGINPPQKTISSIRISKENLFNIKEYQL